MTLTATCIQVSSLDDIKLSSQGDNNAMKTLALDHLGVIAAHLRTSTMKFKRDLSESGLAPLDEIMSSFDATKLQRLIAAHQDLQHNLSRRSSEDQAFDSARELTAVVWGHELALTLQHCERTLSEDAEADRKVVKSLARQQKVALREIWDDPPGDIFELGTSQEEVVRIDRLSEEIGTCQSLKNSFNPILAVVLQALDAPPVFMRTKALKALGQIITSDPSILSAPNVRRGIETHLLDSSPAVRDAAVELIGKYMVDSPKFAADYYQKIADRIADTGLGVRKRVIKLLKAYYSVTEDRGARIDICARIVLRMLDEDDTVKDLAVKTVEELWFSNAMSTLKSSQDNKTEFLTKVAVIMGVAAQFKDRQSPLEDLLHRIMADKSEHDKSALHQRYVEVCETLIDGLVDASDLPGFTVLNCVQTIYLFTSAYPAVLSGSNAATLLPYLKNANTAEEQTTSDYLLRIFRASVPHMPKTAAKFGQELQLALQPMILKPSTAAGVLGLQETVACICATVHHLTHDFGRLVALLRSCNARLQQSVQKPATRSLTPPEQRTLTILLFITSLLCEHCNFDRLRAEEEKFKEDIDKIAKGSVTEHVYMCLLKLYEKHEDQSLRGRILQCLGFLFRAQPGLMTAEPSAKIMDAIFSSPTEESRGRLLKILQDFLIAEAAKHAANEKASLGAKGKGAAGRVNMEELIGNTDGFADSGVSSAIVQRYLDKILEAALSQTTQIQSAAVDILTFTIKQGLAHPLQSFPVIVALETSPNQHLSSRASALHAILHAKHTSLLNARYVNSARSSFDYQKRLTPGFVKGYRMNPGPSALLHRWYTLAREKRATRQDFLRALVKVFDVELGKSSQDDVEFTRYMSENFASFEYKTQEEVLTVTKSLTSILSTAGMQLVEMLSPSHLLAQLRGPGHASQALPPPPALETAMDVVPETVQDFGTLRSSVIVAMIMLLKTHLKTLYGLSEEKCAKFVIGKKSAVGDRPATRKHERPLCWDSLPFATAPMVTSEDVDAQSVRFLEIWSEDGVVAEPEDDMAL
uniref:Sister chromatid cohesion protein n=1 Tax=Ganoderma boninense TaxID=34458 RepID=A0A5K1K5M7_9APHY|nr:Transcriptional repressor TUP1 [Ganoderma boninense]